MKGMQQGFTLIELMIVVTIIAILAAVALPIYIGYSVRTKMSEVVLALSACRTTVSEVYLSAATPPGAGNWGCEVASPATHYVQSITTDLNGKIIATAAGMGPDIDGKVLTMIPMINGVPAVAATDIGKAITAYRCGNELIDGTTIPSKYLPNTCRGQ